MIKNNELYKPIKKELEHVEKRLNEFLHSEDMFISQTVPKILNAGGKRIRPALLLISSKMCNYLGKRSIKLASAIELIHTASLIHDDVLDNDNLRRGVPTINSTWGNTIPVLLGDYLYSTVFNMLAENEDIEIMRHIASTTSIMAIGDLRHLRSQYNLDLSEDKYLSINADKTASLTSCACRVGAMLGNGHNGEVEKLSRYGLNLGMAFQITDDLLDIIAEEKVLGKPLGSDIRGGKMTLPLICVMRNADKNDKEWIGSALRSKQVDDSSLKRIREMVTHYKGIDYCMQKAEEYGTACKEELKTLEQSEGHNSLKLFADFVVNRAC